MNTSKIMATPHDIALDALDKMKAEIGESSTFSADQIWPYASEHVQSTQRPSAITKLWREGHIVRTGNMRNAASEQRAGSKVLEYKFASSADAGGGGFVENKSIVRCKISCSLITKPFMILTGPSGTGKTREAGKLTRMICGEDAHTLVAVGADWTDNRHVLGYLNPLETVEADGKVFPIYETTPILDLILHANGNREEPHVLILDEMNLSHVERYFADFLSAMELEDKGDALKLHAAGTAKTRTGVEIPGSIDFPSNLFVIGTVNIDETTYMFSPKVLDRANVIEIHAAEKEIEGFLKGTGAAGGEAEAKDYGIPFLEAAQVIQGDAPHDKVPGLPDAVRDAAADHLLALFRIMKRGRGEYGFRTGKEVMAYLRAAHFLAGPDAAARSEWVTGEIWLDALDAQILQKILPKLHGSRSRLAPLLGALATYCATGLEKHAMEHFPADSTPAERGLKEAGGTGALKFPKSHEKLKRMIDVLVEEQFVSFIC